MFSAVGKCKVKLTAWGNRSESRGKGDTLREGEFTFDGIRAEEKAKILNGEGRVCVSMRCRTERRGGVVKKCIRIK